MANVLHWFRNTVDAFRGIGGDPQDRCDALFILEDMDKCRNLHTSVAILSFFVSAAFGVLAFFLISESVFWAGVPQQLAILLVSISWVLIFPIWALIFLFIMSLLAAMGIRDVRAVVRHGLSKLSLSREQLQDLRGILASRPWRHGTIFKSVVAELMKEPLES